jgi:hypothetical protein
MIKKERTPSATREFKCLLVKEFILHFQRKGFKIFDPSARGKDEYCGPCQLQGMTLTTLKEMKHPYFLLLQEMFSYRGVSLIDAYLNGTAESNKECKRLYLEFLNWVFFGNTSLLHQ